MITIPASRYKGKRDHIIPIIRPVLETLEILPRSLTSEYVLTKPQSGTRYRDMRTPFECACRKAEFNDVTWHTLRHTGASWLVMAGVDLYTLQELMGLSSINMVQRYAHLAPDYKAREVAKIEDYFRTPVDIQGMEEKS